MNKLIEIIVSGILFKMEEAAWEKLQNYIAALKKHFTASDGNTEIIEDIESRIAELFMTRSESKGYVSEKDVEEVIAMMGTPFEMTDETETQEERRKNQEEYTYTTGARKLFRDPENSLIGGVCGGLSSYFDIDATWIRLGFAVSLFFFGTGIIVYLILWFIVPQANSAGDRLQMKGRKVTAENIANFFQTEASRLKKNFSEFEKSDTAKKWREKAGAMKSDAERLAHSGMNAVARMIAGFFSAIAFVILVSFLLGYFGLFNDFTFLPLNPITDAIYEEAWESTLAIVAVILLVCVPLIAIITKGLFVVFGIYRTPAYLRHLYSFAWGIAWILLLIIGGRTAYLFSTPVKENVQQTDTLSADTLVISAPGNEQYEVDYDMDDNDDDFDIEYVNKKLITRPRINIIRTQNGICEINTVKKSHGKNKEDAIRFLQQMNKGYSLRQNAVYLTPFVNQDHPSFVWRNQGIEINFKIPVGKKIIFEGNAIHSLREYPGKTSRKRMRDKVLVMTEDGLVPVGETR